MTKLEIDAEKIILKFIEKTAVEELDKTPNDSAREEAFMQAWDNAAHALCELYPGHPELYPKAEEILTTLIAALNPINLKTGLQYKPGPEQRESAIAEAVQTAAFVLDPQDWNED